MTYNCFIKLLFVFLALQAFVTCSPVKDLNNKKNGTETIEKRASASAIAIAGFVVTVFGVYKSVGDIYRAEANKCISGLQFKEAQNPKQQYYINNDYQMCQCCSVYGNNVDVIKSQKDRYSYWNVVEDHVKTMWYPATKFTTGQFSHESVTVALSCYPIGGRAQNWCNDARDGDYIPYEDDMLEEQVTRVQIDMRTSVSPPISLPGQYPAWVQGMPHAVGH